MAEAQPTWRFTGVDPSPAMLDLARQTLAPFADRVDLIQGSIDQAPLGPFDGATCLLTLRHLDRDERAADVEGYSLPPQTGCESGGRGALGTRSRPQRWMTRSFGDRERLD
jgi:tRNA (cmo5U34)-methyltransferase